MGGTSRMRSNLGKESAIFDDCFQTPDPRPHRGDDCQGYACQCQMFGETALYHFNNSAAWHWVCLSILKI